ERRRVAEYSVTTAGASLDFGIGFGEWGEFRTGLARARIHTAVITGSADLPSGRVDYGALRTRMAILRIDNPSIPHDGGSLSFMFDLPRRSLGGDADYRKLLIGASAFTTVKSRLTFYAGAEGGSNLGSDMALYDQFAIGGLLSMGGFAPGQLNGDRYAVVHTGIYYRVRDLSPDLGEGVYIGAFSDAGNAWPAGVPATIRSAHRSVTLAVGAQTIAGPIMFAHGRAETGDHRFYFTIGKSF
ncbi:MAG TPA: BamA/TamA family outer membrane protein, partial [Thermoanaerobaculia bacterium]|nr:BamA/TamA family outer membrane protein [Thermoanaerobaculia bacterium]